MLREARVRARVAARPNGNGLVSRGGYDAPARHLIGKERTCASSTLI